MEQDKLNTLLEEIPNDWATLSLIMNYVGHKYWEAAVKERGPGAVQFLEYEDSSLVVFTRGEYREQLKNFVRELPNSQERSVEIFEEDLKRL